MTKFNKRKWWWFNNHKKSIGIEIAGFTSHPSAYISVDGDEGEVTFHIGCFIGIWLTFENFLPENWYPVRWSTYCNTWLPEEREISIAIHGGSLWWNLWKNDDEGFHKTWRKGCFGFWDKIRGKCTYENNIIEVKEFVLPFLEGNYNVEVTKSQRAHRWQRWFTKKWTGYNVKVGYYNENKEWVSQGVPVEGKGENSWDCGEDATYEMSFPGLPYNKSVKSCYDAALYFWNSMMKDRERRGSSQWLPEKFRERGLSKIA